ncbi:MAG: sensor histidine kinase [Microbacterium sp.]
MAMDHATAERTTGDDSGARPPSGDPRRQDAAQRDAPTRRELRQDLVLAAVLFVASQISAALSSISVIYSDAADLGWAVLLGVGTTLPLALRKRFPVTVAIVVSTAYFLGVTFQVPELYVGNAAMFISIYTIGAWSRNRRLAAWARAGIIAGMLVWLLITTYISVTQDAAENGQTAGALSPFVSYMLLQWLINIAYFGGSYYLGDHAHRAALNRQHLRELTRQLEEERELSAAQAVALDRVRIARELHDVVGHHVSAMGVQAGAARTILAADPGRAAAVLQDVEKDARTAIDELHRLLDTLRDPGEGGEAPSALKLADIDALASRMTASGTPTTLTVVGDPVALPALVETNLYRIAQESLTNARRHGGPDATADVRLRYARDAVELEVTNTGRVRAGARPGVGQLGMRERATAIGAVLHFGRRDPAGESSVERSGYLVRVTVPLGGSAVGGGDDS